MQQKLGGLLLLVATAAFGQTVDQLFDDNVLQEIRLTIHPRDWKALADNYLDNTYYPATMEWRGQVIENVGIRSKGRSSRRPTKPGLRVDFNRFEDQEFLGLKSFLLDNNITDYGVIRERLCSLLWREAGLPAPKETNAKLFVNDQYMGVYTLMESTDKRFLKNWLAEDEGYLYEYVHREGYRFQWLDGAVESYVPVLFKPETNEKNPEGQVIVEFIQVINQTSDQDFPRVIEQYLDVKKFLTHMALEVYVAEWDGILSDAGVANLYFYRFKGSKKGVVLFKDKDLTFNTLDYQGLKNADQNVLMRRLMAVPEWKQFLNNEILRVAATAGGEDGFLAKQIEKAYGQIREATLSDTLKECTTGACSLAESNVEFERQVAFLRDFAINRPTEVVRQLGLEPKP